MNKKIFIIGDTGLLGQELIKNLKNKDLLIIKNSSLKNPRPNFEKKKEALNVLNHIRPDFIINCSGATDVDLCEKKLSYAKKNFIIAKNISGWMKKNNFTKLIHISTDQVYSGVGPHIEKNTKPVNNYAKSKLKAESYLSDVNACILRTNFFGFSITKKSFTDWIFQSIKLNKKIYLFKNIKFNPLSISKLCLVINHIIMTKFYKGTYNLGSKNSLSKADFAKIFIHYLKKDYINYETIIFSQNFVAKRSLDMATNIKKFEKKFKYKLPYLLNEIKNELKKYKNFK